MNNQQASQNSNRPKYVLLGGGSHARVILDAILCAGWERPYAVLDENQSLHETDLYGVPVVGGDRELPRLIEEGVTSFVVGVGSTGNAAIREKIYKSALTYGLNPLTVIHPSAAVSARATIGAGALILANAVVNPGARLGENVVVNSGAVVEHDCRLDAHVHIAPGATLAGDVKIGVAAHIGVGATVIQQLSVGARTIVGAGSVVLNNVPDDVVVIGVPARVLRRVAAA